MNKMENSQPLLSFLKTADEMDGPMDDEGIAETSERDPSEGVDECGMYGVTRCSPTVDVSLERLGIIPREDSAHPSYTTYESRLESFSSWPIHVKLRPEALCDAGFFYTGKSDRTMCYQCGGGLKDWEENDDPWKEHARYFPRCTHLVQKKGRDFINEVLGRNCPQVGTSSSLEMPQPQHTSSSTSRAEENSLGPDCYASDLGSSGYSSGGSFGGEEPAKSQEPKSKKSDAKVIDDQRACKICYAEEMGVVFLPCGHLVACVNCAPSLKTCAVCRKPFSATVRAYLS